MKLWKLYIAASERFWYAFLAAAIALVILLGRSVSTGSNAIDFFCGAVSAFIIMGAALGTMSAFGKKRAASKPEQAQ